MKTKTIHNNHACRQTGLSDADRDVPIPTVNTRIPTEGVRNLTVDARILTVDARIPTVDARIPTVDARILTVGIQKAENNAKKRLSI